MGTIKTKAAKYGKKKNKKSATYKGTHLSQGSLDFLEAADFIFGELVAEFIKERLVGLSEENQKELNWHILHYMYREEILPTGDPDVDIRLSEVIEKLPFLNLEMFRYLSREKIEKMKKTSESSQFAS